MSAWNFSLPMMTPEELNDPAALRRLAGYLFQMNEQLRYVLSSLDEENFTNAFLENVVGAGETALDAREVRLINVDGAAVAANLVLVDGKLCVSTVQG